MLRWIPVSIALLLSSSALSSALAAESQPKAPLIPSRHWTQSMQAARHAVLARQPAQAAPKPKLGLLSALGAGLALVGFVGYRRYRRRQQMYLQRENSRFFEIVPRRLRAR